MNERVARNELESYEVDNNEEQILKYKKRLYSLHLCTIKNNYFEIAKNIN